METNSDHYNAGLIAAADALAKAVSDWNDCERGSHVLRAQKIMLEKLNAYQAARAATPSGSDATLAEWKAWMHANHLSITAQAIRAERGK